MYISKSRFFSKHMLDEFLRKRLDSIKDTVLSISKEQFATNDDDNIVAYAFALLEIMPLSIYRDMANLSEPKDTKIQKRDMPYDEMYEAHGVTLELTVPYTGESELWELRPNHYDLNSPAGSAMGHGTQGQLKFSLFYLHNEFQSDKVNAEIDGFFRSVEKYVEWINQDVRIYHEKLRSGISQQVRLRREQLGAIHNTVQRLTIPISKKDGAPAITRLPIQKKVIPSLSSKVNSMPEYGISDDVYKHILEIIQHEGSSFERTPRTFVMHGEEGLRDILLAHLNGHFKGQASGETFRKKGKTDIHIEFENRAAFVAECKLWKGPQQVQGTIDQLLGYLTWRDVKAAIIFFNKDAAGFKQLQEKLENILKEHSNCLSVRFEREKSQWVMKLRSKEDPDRHIFVQVFVFNLFVDKP